MGHRTQSDLSEISIDLCCFPNASLQFTMSTAAESVAAILMVHPETLAKDWKRRIKYDQDSGEARVFENAATGTFCTVYSLGQDIVVKEGNLLPKTDPDLMKRLIKAGSAIRHCGDYGLMYWNEIDQTVWMSMGDGDCPSEKHPEDNPGKLTTWEEIERSLLEAGAKKVLIEAEHSPDWDSANEVDDREPYGDNDAGHAATWWKYTHVKEVKGKAVEHDF